MTPVLKFVRGEFDREVVWLGAKRIGEIEPHNGRHARAAVTLRLPDFEINRRPSESLFAARSVIVRKVEEWLMQIGVFYPGQSVDIEAPEDAEGGQKPRNEARTA